MLIRERQALDLQKVCVAHEPIQVNTDSMRCQLGVQSCTESPKSMGMVRLDMKLPGQLAVDRFDDLPEGIVGLLESRIDLAFLIATRQGV